MKKSLYTLFAVLLAATVTLYGCDKSAETQQAEANMEQAGENLEQAGENLGNAAENQAKEAGAKIEAAGDEAAREINEAGDKIEAAGDRAAAELKADMAEFGASTRAAAKSSFPKERESATALSSF